MVDIVETLRYVRAQIWAYAPLVRDDLVPRLDTAIAELEEPLPHCDPQDDPRDREIEKLRSQLVQMEKDHREDMRDAAAQARHAARFPDEPYGTY